MFHKAIQDLEPRLLWESFYQVTQIPRPSKKEEKIAKFITDIASTKGFPSREDDAGNIVVSKPPTKGMEQRPTIVLQSHMDMVCEKNEQKEHDFEKEPISLKREGDWIMADDTSLGADNGIGVAAALTIIKSDTIAHGPLELLFTVDEETGLTGAKALEGDFLKGRILLNLDSEEEGTLFIGGAGGLSTTLTRAIEWGVTPSRCVAYKVKVDGLCGGHSGLDINKGLGNAIKLIVRFLFHLAQEVKAALFSLNSGEKHNAIPREAEAGIVIRVEDEILLQKMVKKFETIYKNELQFSDKSVRLNIKPILEPPSRVFSSDFQNTLISLLYTLHHGVSTMSYGIPGQVETSSNLAAVHTFEKQVEILTSQRSSSVTGIDDCANKIKAAGLLADMEVREGNHYPVWQPDPNSRLLKTALSAYHELYGCEPQVTTIHAGLECGIIRDHFKGMETISFGPTIKSPHSPDERMNIQSVKKFWDYLVHLLKKIK
ncbi:MAG: aminoacyl-histidine dipeptidase [Candidatus Scalindua sp.]|nr:aminoacyl-histidine dipeptidase [Planctomycetota bacterium]GJQ58558.1 MAG: aminoacyl-histidine dipeptidase [Candidatus Scalindua sp.]